jgi:hypothetical protein
LKLEPHVERVDCASGKEVADLPRTDDNVHAIRLARPDYRIHSIERRCYRRKLHVTGSGAQIPLFSDCECGCKLQAG